MQWLLWLTICLDGHSAWALVDAKVPRPVIKPVVAKPIVADEVNQAQSDKKSAPKPKPKAPSLPDSSVTIHKPESTPQAVWRVKDAGLESVPASPDTEVPQFILEQNSNPKVYRWGVIRGGYLIPIMIPQVEQQGLPDPAWGYPEVVRQPIFGRRRSP